MVESLGTAERTYVAECEGCMAEAVRILDRSAALQTNGVGAVPGEANREFNHRRPEAAKALEQGRRVFEREFGISLPESRKKG